MGEILCYRGEGDIPCGFFLYRSECQARSLFCRTLERIQKIVKRYAVALGKQDQCGGWEEVRIVIFPV